MAVPERDGGDKKVRPAQRLSLSNQLRTDTAGKQTGFPIKLEPVQCSKKVFGGPQMTRGSRSRSYQHLRYRGRADAHHGSLGLQPAKTVDRGGLSVEKIDHER